MPPIQKAKKDAHPRKTFGSILQNGLTAFDLATKHQSVLEPRLPTGLIDQLAADLSTLGAQVPGAKQAHAAAQSATAQQESALSLGYALVSAIRTAVARTDAPAEVRKAYGVGRRINPRLVKDVKLAIGMIVARAGAAPTEAASLGILSSDVTALSAANEAIQGADEVQEKARANAPLSTKARNETARRIMGAVDRIAGAGILQFAASPMERAHFEALIGWGNAKSAKKGAPNPQ